MAYQIGQPGVSAFLQSLLRDLDVVIQIGDHVFLPINTELKEVQNFLFGFEDVLLDGEKRRQLGNKAAERWMDDLKDLFYDIDDLLHEVKMEKQQLQREITGEPSTDKVRHNFSDGHYTTQYIKNRLGHVLDILRKLTEVSNRLELKRNAVKHDETWLESHAKFRPKQGSFADEPMIHGREDDKNKIIEMLLTEDCGERKRKYEVVCVVGMGGLGKTTVAQLVFQDERVKGFFGVRSWACVSDIVDVIKVTKDLIESTSRRGDGATNLPSALPALQDRLQNIINGKKFLIVLDDVWTTKELVQLKGPLNSGANGSKILVTTRLRKVAEDLGNKEPYRLERLEHAQCLKIFYDNAFGDEDGIDNDEDLMKIGEEIVKKCGGVPLVAKVIGSLLTGEDERKWKAVNDNDLWCLAYKDEDLHPGLRLSYFYLPPFLKRCFEYFALFPSDFEFEQDELVRLWMAEGLIEVEEGIEPEEMGHQYYKDLKGRSLIQEDNKIHDMLHHLACIVSGSFFFRGSNGSSLSTSSLQSVRHAFIQYRPEFLKLIESRKLRTLIYRSQMYEQFFSYDWWRNLEVNSRGCDLKHLRYLKLSDRTTTLPYSICTLRNLRVLVLSYCQDLVNLPQDLSKLSNLWFLGLNSTCITVLPDSVCSLSNLRVLNLSRCKCLTTLPKDMGNLESLHELILENSSLSSLPESIVNATNLRVLNIDESDILTLPAHIGKLRKLDKLSDYIVGKEEGRGIHELKDMNRIKGNLSIFNLENIQSEEAALMANLRRKKHIEGLSLFWTDFDAALTGRDGEMEVRVMEALEPNPAIKSLSFRNYVGHKFPFWMSNAPLNNLTDLVLIDLPALREMTGMEFKSLLNLKVDKCPVLRKVSLTTAKLETLDVRKCKELKPASLVILPLVWDALESLECEYCHLDHFVQQLKSTNASPPTKLKWLTVWVGGDNGITSLPVGSPSIFTSLENLTLYGLAATNFKIVSEEDESCSVAPSELLVSITFLAIRKCPGLVSLESLELPPRLKTLYIWDCPNLRKLPYGLSSLTSLEQMDFSDCPVLEIRPHQR